MNEQEALKDIVESGINLGAGDYVNVESLKVAAKAIEENQQYKALGTVEELKELKKLSHRIYDVPLHQDEYKMFERIEAALGFKLFVWQKTYILNGYYRRYGKTVAECLKILLEVQARPLDLTQFPKGVRQDFFKSQLREIQQKLTAAGIATRTIFYCNADKDRYAKQMPSGYGFSCSNADVKCEEYHKYKNDYMMRHGLHDERKVNKWQ